MYPYSACRLNVITDTSLARTFTDHHLSAGHVLSEMKVFVRCLPGPSDFELDLDGDMTLADVRALLECETDIEASQLVLHHSDRPLVDLDSTLDACDVRDGNTLYVSTAAVP